LIKYKSGVPDVRCTPLGAYATYCSVKAHFGGSYDMSKYGILKRPTKAQLDKRGDRQFFGMAAKRYTINQLANICVSNEVRHRLHPNGANFWIGDIKIADSIDIHNAWARDILLLPELIRADIKSMLVYCKKHDKSFSQMITPVDACDTAIFNLVRKAVVRPETFIFLLALFPKLGDKYKAVIKSDPAGILFKKKFDALEMYGKLFTIDTEQSVCMIKEIKAEIKSHANE
jgi:hypothetical protein